MNFSLDLPENFIKNLYLQYFKRILGQPRIGKKYETPQNLNSF